MYLGMCKFSPTWFVIHLNGNGYKFVGFTSFRRGKQGNRRKKVPHGPVRVMISFVRGSFHVITQLITHGVDAILFYGLKMQKYISLQSRLLIRRDFEKKNISR